VCCSCDGWCQRMLSHSGGRAGAGRARAAYCAAEGVGSALLLGLAGDGWGCRAGADQRAGAQYPPPAGGLAGAGTYACFELGTGRPVLDRSGNCAPTSLTLRGAQMDLGPPGFLRVVFGGPGVRRGFPDRGVCGRRAVWGLVRWAFMIRSVLLAGLRAIPKRAGRAKHSHHGERVALAGGLGRCSPVRRRGLSAALARDSETNLWARFAFM
jgi:hypothetical protein